MTTRIRVPSHSEEPVCHTHVLTYFNQVFKQSDLYRIKNYDDRFTRISVIGTGRFGAIEKVFDKEKSIHVAAKIVNLQLFDHLMQNFSKIKNRVDTFIKEFKTISDLGQKSERIAHFYGIFSDSQRIITITEYAERGTVKDQLDDDGLDETRAVKYFYQAAQGLEFLHSQAPTAVVHRDVKAANLLVTANDDVKLSNFGLVKDLTIGGFGLAVASDITEDFRFTLLYVAPEVLLSDLGPADSRSYNSASDIWALGCTFVEMLTKFPPYFEYYDGNVGFHYDFVNKSKKSVDKQLPYDCFSLVPTASTFTRFIINKVFDKDPETRISAKGLIQFLDSVDSDHSNEKTHLENEFSKALESSLAQKSLITPNATKKTVFKSIKQMSIQNLVKLTSSSSPAAKKREDESVDSNSRATYDVVSQKTTPSRKRKKRKKKKSFFESLLFSLQYTLFRSCCFAGILCKSVSYVVLFVFIGLGTLATFFCLATGIVALVRLIVAYSCECDLDTPQILIISGIFLILLFALFFSCCMVALGEYKFRVANKSLHNSRFFVKRPSKDINLLGLRLVRGKKNDLLEDIEDMDDEEDMDIEMNAIMPKKSEMDEFYEACPTPVPSVTVEFHEGLEVEVEDETLSQRGDNNSRRPTIIQEEPSRKLATVNNFKDNDFNDLYCNEPNSS